MIITHTIVCLTCETKHLLKVTLGYENKQHHTFPCTECEEDIQFGIENLPRGEYRYIKNCRFEKFKYDEAVQVLLHPDLAVGHKIVPAGDVVTATLLNVKEMSRMFKQSVPEKLKQHRSEHQNMGSQKLRFFLKVWSLLRRNKSSLAQEFVLKNYNIHGAKMHADINTYIEDFLNHFIGDFGLKVYEGLEKEWAKSTNKKSLIDFNKIQEVDEFEVFEEFFDLYTEFSQVYLYLNGGIEINKKNSSSSTDFNKTKKYYSSAYEVVAKLLYIPAGINNIIERGDANEFKSLKSLEVYMNNGNGNKLNCFLNNEELKYPKECYDNNIRNASFHNHMKFNAKKSKITYTKNNNDVEHISYQDYLILCVKISEVLAAYKLFKIRCL
ncbi:hypothetical protein [Photobacterium phosphoreum]|uniref:hypothetical protein n=1 Tax=Photobacterium phosphoreum TaxID=659 RepID=UPI000D182967|nr:hypothetical protein [Photobacterium phosphoreum]PSU36576.1 hypothetical protein CTM85_16360 [Photobacterium phosphoreum]